MKHDPADLADVADHPTVEDPPTAVSRVFGAWEAGPELARRYAGHLATTGVEHGLIGPRELPRLWSRHVLNCAVVAEAVPQDAHVIDIGSGAGLPGIALAIARPDLTVTLVEPLERRCRWLTMVVDDLELTDRVRVDRARAEDRRGVLDAEVVTSRAVAALPKLLGWSLPLVSPGGQVLAMKGERAAEELDAVRPLLAQCGIDEAGIEVCGVGSLEVSVRVVRVVVPEDFNASAMAKAFGIGGGAKKGSSRGSRGRTVAQTSSPRVRRRKKE